MNRGWRWLIGDWWKVRRCGWPYPSGYCAYNRYRRTLLDAGCTKEQAREACRKLNE